MIEAGSSCNSEERGLTFPLVSQANYTEAFGVAVNAGLGAYYGYWVSNFRDAMFDLLGAAVNGDGEHISLAQLKVR